MQAHHLLLLLLIKVGCDVILRPSFPRLRVIDKSVFVCRDCLGFAFNRLAISKLSNVKSERTSVSYSQHDAG